MQEIVVDGPDLILIVHGWNKIWGLSIFGPEDAVSEVSIHVELLNHGVNVAGASQIFKPRIPRRRPLLKLIAVDNLHVFHFLI